MGRERDAFLIYKRFYAPISKLSDKQLGKLFRAIFKYQLGDVVEVDGDIDMAFEFFKSQFENDERKYQSTVEKNRENGRKGGMRRSDNTPKCENGNEGTGKGEEGGNINSGHDKAQANQATASESSDRYPTLPTATDRPPTQANQADKNKIKINKESPSNEGQKKAVLSSSPCLGKIDYTKLKDYFNDFAKQAGIPQISVLTEARKAAIRARVAQYDKETIGAVMRKVVESDFLCGKNDRDWQATFDWIFKQQNFIRILDGEFDNKKHRTGYTAKYGNVNDEWK